MRALRILLVDDDPADVLLTRRALSQTQHRIDLAVVSNGEEAMNYLLQTQGFERAVIPDLILIDLNMPRKNGHDLLEEVKSSPSLCSIPCVVLSTSGHPTDVRRAYASHANSFVRKPSDFGSFTRVIQEMSNFWFSVVRLSNTSRT